MRKPLTVLSLPLLLATTACTMAPSYTQPTLPVAAAWPVEVGEPTTEQAAGWQAFFADPHLQQVIATALENNRDLRVATLNVEAARAAYGIQRADLLPSIDAEGTLTASRTPKNASSTGSSSNSRLYEANLASTAYELDLFGRVRSLNKAALEDWLATDAARQSARLSLIAETANAYLQWLAAREIKALTEETLAAQQETLNLVQTNYDNGVVGKLDLAQARQAAETARANLALYTRQADQARTALVLLLGTTDLPKELTTPPALADITLPAPLPEGLPGDVLLARPDIQQAEHTLKSMYANIGAARAAFFPTISLTGSFGFASGELSELFAAGSGGAWAFVPSISLPIFEGGRNLMNLRVSNAKRDIALANYEKAIQTAFKEVADGLTATRTLAEQQDAQMALAEAAQDAYDISKLRYDEGIDRFLTVLDTQRTLYAAQTAALQVQQQVLANRINLYKALGGTEAPQ